MNLLSLLLGIAALAFAVHSLQVRGCLNCSTLSGFCCSAALLCQLADNDRIARLEDIAAMLDTAHSRVVCAADLPKLPAKLQHLTAGRPLVAPTGSSISFLDLTFSTR